MKKEQKEIYKKIVNYCNIKDIDVVNKNKNYMFSQVKKILNKVNSFYDKS